MGLFSDILGSQGSKEARRQEDISNQRQEVESLLQQALAQLVPGSQEYNELLALGQNLVMRTAEGPFAIPELDGQVLDQQQAITALGQKFAKQQGDRIAAGGPATPLESRTDLASKGLREAAAFQPYEQDLFDAMTGGTAAIDTDAGHIFQDMTRRAISPDEYYKSTFQPALDLLQDRVKSRAASRGVLGSGLELEDLGRTGSELAIREGEAKESFRRTALDDFLSGVFDRGQTLRNRQLGLEEALTNLQLGRETNLTDLLNNNTNSRLNDYRDILGGRAEQDVADRVDAEDIERSKKGQIGSTLGTLAGGVIGGPAGAAVGGKLGGSLGGGGGSNDISSLLGEQRTATTSGQQGPTFGLSRSPQQLGQLSADELLKLLAQGGA